MTREQFYNCLKKDYYAAMKQYIAEKGDLNVLLDDLLLVYRAVKKPANQIAKLLIDSGCELVQNYPAGWRHLAHECAQVGNIEILKYLLDNKHIEIDIVDEDGWTPLHYACNLSRHEVVKFLISRGANVNALDYEGKTPLSLVITDEDQRNIVITMIKNGALIKDKKNYGKESI